MNAGTNFYPSSAEETFSSSNKMHTDDSLEVVFESSDNGQDGKEEEEINVSQSSTNVGSLKEVCKFEDSVKYKMVMNGMSVQQSAILFIQMQLCHITLRQWLDVRNQDVTSIDPTKMQEMFKQIVRGVEFIHSQGIVHHDIKPSNIFVSHDLRLLQVGDFGLACRLITHPQTSLSVVTTHIPGQLGTKLYAAPEQLKGVCHAKSDVYSLGIVLFELIKPFNTAMERSKVLSQLRNGHIPTELNANFNDIALIISRTVSTLNKRPTSAELLESLSEAQNQKNHKVMEEQMKTITELRRESLAKDEEIASLKRRLEELSTLLEQ